MPELNRDAAPLPYADVSQALLALIYDSLYIIYESRFRDRDDEALLERLIKRAEKINAEKWTKATTKNNLHLLDGIPEPKGQRSGGRLYDTGLEVPRISRLCLEACAYARRSTSTAAESAKGIFVPSPLAILTDALTTPWRPESYGYGFALSRAILFSHYRIHPPVRTLPKSWTALSIPEVQDAIETFRIYANHRDNIHYSKTNKAKVFLAHFLAMKGVFVLRFGTTGKAPKLAKAKDDCLEFLEAKEFLTGRSLLQAHYEFRLAPGLIDIPDTQEILNSLMGVPVLIAGGTTVFFEGLQRSHQESLVISVSGAPGTGKTSFALALGASLAPFGTQCLYCTFEEDAETLTRRALGVVPEYFRRTTLLHSERPEWLTPVPLDPAIVKGVGTLASEYISILKRELNGLSSPDNTANSLPGVAPFLIVVDSLTTLLGKTEDSRLEHFCTFVRYLRDLNCLVLLLSAEDIPKDSRLEYLVDTVVSLRHEGTDSADKKPVRLFQLIKSRLQMSRPGSHVLHLSGDRGVRLSPQLPSQLDSHKIHRTPLPDHSRVLDILKVDKSASGVARVDKHIDRLINLYPNSKILIHGHGSSAKAALALRLLMAHSVSATSGSPSPLAQHKRPRILVVSFLYSRDHYEIYFRKLLRVGLRSKAFRGNPPKMHVLALTPSFIGPEDLIGKVLLEMDRGHLEGWPYTGVLLDGLHNTFLQFPSLQDSHMVWPAIYSLLSRYDLTIATTFTTFSKSNAALAGRIKDDEELILQGQLPFLHVLVQGTDFLLQVEPRNPRHHDRTFHVSVESAVGQKIPGRSLVWNADTLTFDRFEERRQGSD
jgi:KaiC/GvpD/RAD55 family RecA-like ATPase